MQKKNGIHISGKRVYCDLLFVNDNEEFILWVQDLEDKLKNLIYDKRVYGFIMIQTEKKLILTGMI